VRAVVLHETGPAEKLKVEDVPIPEVTPGHALVKVRASGDASTLDRGGIPAYPSSPR